MKILDYEFLGTDWKIHKTEFQDVNLIVGDSGTGKTRLLNTMFNFGTFVAQGKTGGISEWNLTLQISPDKYKWNVAFKVEDNKSIVKNETISRNDEVILTREGIDYVFQGKPLPKLPKDQMSVSVLKEEEVIKPIYDGFSKMLRRRFFGDVLETNSAIYLGSEKVLHKLGEIRDLYELYKAELPLSPRLFVLKSYFPDIYKKIVTFYLESFPYIDEIDIRDGRTFSELDVPTGTPVFCIKEHNANKWIKLPDLSSGMQKALLITTDLLTLPKGSIYLIDEYENSLGVGPINFLPNILASYDIEMQLFITSHHPYLISKFPVENWYVSHRKGMEIKFAYGEELVSRYSISKQDKYLQLLNDPYYIEGVE
jgi:predicted ATPase